MAKSVRVFENDKNIIPSGKWRLYNEIPTVLMILIIVFVVVKPL
ncbi:MAG: CopD family protein [Pseudomonadota bacterium]